MKFGALFFAILFLNQAVAADRFPIKGTFTEQFAELRTQSGYDNNSPSKEILEKILIPLSSIQEADISFNPGVLQQIKDEFHPAGPYVHRDWQLITLHRFPYRLMGGIEPFFAESKYEPFEVPGLGSFLFALGHEELPELQMEGLKFAMAINRIPFGERPDLGLIHNPEHNIERRGLKVAETLTVGESVYIIHAPFLTWLEQPELLAMRESSPFISSASIQQVNGNIAIIDAMAFQGSSGGVVLNAAGEVIGPATFALRTSTQRPPITGVMILNDRMKEIIRNIDQPQ